MVKGVFGNRLLGVVFILILLSGLWVVKAVFNQSFTSFDKVGLHTDATGLQLPARADVKVRGVIVGEVLAQTAQKNGAELTLGIQPGKISQIPKNVHASILPKTLFGEKYIELSIPKNPAGVALAPGDRIAQTRLPVELEAVLSDLYPLLRTVQPADLNYTLNAVATALEGRGNQIGQNFVTLNNYLKRTNPQVPALIHDLNLLSKVSGTYADVTPQIAATLRNTVTTGNTLVSRQARLHQFLQETAAFSDTTRAFLNTNGNNIIRLGQLSAPVLALLARYSSEFPCLIKGIVRQAPRLASTFRGFIFHIQIETLPSQPRGYGPQDIPVYGADNAPSCSGLPNPPGSQAHPFHGAPNFNDGANGLGRGDGQRSAVGFDRVPQAKAGATPRLGVGTGGTAAQKGLVDALIAPVMGVPVDKVPDLTTLLFGPLMAGTRVSVQ
ncbi:MAG: MCE family protein [Actinomycetota bacterium]|nr:MCE family protein [Actinomycetota bacterium]